MAASVSNSMARALLAASASLLVLSACASSANKQVERPPLDLEGQNWSDDQRYAWYRGSQGSRLIPEKWLMALEARDSSTLFMDSANFARFNYLPGDLAPPSSRRSKRKCPSAGANDSGLPIGFARDCQSDEKLEVTRLRWYQGQSDRESWIGLNCAACHTNRISYKGQSVVVDGAPALADFQSFTRELLLAMQGTFNDPAKWRRFADRVLTSAGPGGSNGPQSNAADAPLRAAFEKLLFHQETLAAFNATKIEYGHGRLDAVGHILNKVAMLNKSNSPIRGEPNAPVSYPFIWNVNQHDFVQWNGLVPNQKILRGRFDIGALVRNTSEVIGVFADVRTKQNVGFGGYRSSVDVENLAAMETQLAKLMSPKWPAAFGTFDAPEAQRQIASGKLLFQQHCAGCHAPLARNDLTTPITAEMTPVGIPGGIGTDPWMACNAFAYKASGGNLTGTKALIFRGAPLPDVGPTRDYLGAQAVGVLLGKKWDVIRAAARGFTGGGEIEVFEAESAQPPSDQPRTAEQRLSDCKAAAWNAQIPVNVTADSPLRGLSQAEAGTDDGSTIKETRRILAYKGRPLNGIWATAPYLHNGSVRSLYDLLLDPKDRPTRFWVGNREFDPVDVGFVSEERDYGSWFRTKDTNGQDIIGNSNLGHDYGNADFSEDERRALVAYMKTL